MDRLTVALTAFVLIVPVELPDKTFVATLVLSTRYRPLPVWLGVSAAFGVHAWSRSPPGTCCPGCRRSRSRRSPRRCSRSVR